VVFIFVAWASARAISKQQQNHSSKPLKVGPEIRSPIPGNIPISLVRHPISPISRIRPISPIPSANAVAPTRTNQQLENARFFTEVNKGNKEIDKNQKSSKSRAVHSIKTTINLIFIILNLPYLSYLRVLLLRNLLFRSAIFARHKIRPKSSRDFERLRPFPVKHRVFEDIIHFSIAKKFSRLHPTSPDFTRLHPTSPDFTRLHPTSPEFTRVRASSPDFDRLRSSSTENRSATPPKK
jgi:hypothetical protein